MSDARVTLARSDLADSALQGVVRAPRYARAQPRQVTVPVTPLRSAAASESEQADELLFGEIFDVLEEEGGVAWGQARRDGYVGFVAVTDLTADIRLPTHVVSAPSTFVLASPEVRGRAWGPLSLNALVRIEGETEGEFLRVAGGGWIAVRHLRPIGGAAGEPAAIAEALVGVPYLWGGRSTLGLDCSGLVQQALYACGRACPRDTDQQQALGRDVERAKLARGDLVFWRGHVGMMLDGVRLAHANAHHMAVGVEPLDEACGRIAAKAGDPTAFRRI